MMSGENPLYLLSHEQKPIVQICIGRLEWEVTRYIDSLVPCVSVTRLRNILFSASSAECAAELLRRLIPGAFVSFRPQMNRWLDEWQAGIATRSPLQCQIHPVVSDDPVPASPSLLLSDVNQSAVIEECARYLDAVALSFLKHHNREEWRAAKEDWLNLSLRFDDWAKALRLLTAEGQARARRNREKVIAFCARRRKGPIPTLERTDNTTH
jgi:hypothetical protein